MADLDRKVGSDGRVYLDKDIGTGHVAWSVVPIDTAGNPLSTIGGGAITVADGSDIAEGATTDAAVVSNAVGSLSAKLRGLVALARKGSGSAPASVAVDQTATGTAILATNANRLVAVFSNNDTTNAVWVGTTTALTATNGIRIPAGGTFADERSTSAWRAICSTGQTATVGVLEVS